MDEPFDLGGQLDASGEHKRAEPRDSLFLQARLAREGHPTLTLRVRNLSSGGLMADCTEPMQRGEPVTIELRGIGEISGKIAWVREQRIGVAFDLRVDPKLARKPVASGDSKSLIIPRPATSLRRPGLRIE